MKVDIPKLVIFEESKDLMKVWEDFFYNKYKLCFINIKSDQNLNKLDCNNKTIFIFNSDIKTNFFDKFKDNKVLFLVDNKRNFKKEYYTNLKEKEFFLKPVSLNEIDQVIQETHYANEFSVHEKIIIKNHLLMPLDKRLVLNRNKESILLTEKEVSILIELSQSKKVVSKEKLLTEVWGYNSQMNTTTVETHIHRLRQKLKKFTNSRFEIKTTSGGYSIL